MVVLLDEKTFSIINVTGEEPPPDEEVWPAIPTWAWWAASAAAVGIGGVILYVLVIRK